MHTHRHTNTYTHTYIHTETHIHTQTKTQTHTCKHKHIRKHTQTRTQRQKLTYTHTQTIEKNKNTNTNTITIINKHPQNEKGTEINAYKSGNVFKDTKTYTPYPIHKKNDLLKNTQIDTNIYKNYIYLPIIVPTRTLK